MDIARIALLAWVPVTAYLVTSYPPAKAALLVMLGSILFLPIQIAFDFPLIPPMGREEISAVLLVGLGLLSFPRRLLRVWPGWGVDSILFIVILGSVGTVLTNTDVLIYGPTVLPALERYEIISNAARDTIGLYLPFLIGRAFFRTSRELRALMLLFVVGMLMYSLFIMIELRLSPQFNRWVYGFHPGRFYSTERWGGYRPRVFVGTGLSLSMLVMVAFLFALGMMRARLPVYQFRARDVAGYLGGLLVACKSFASILYGAVGFFGVALLSPRRQLQIASVLAILTLLYPMSRNYEIFPTEDLIAAASNVSADRAWSLEYRFMMEDRLLEKANERVLFGWGGGNRSRVFDEMFGKMRTVADGYWIIQLGVRGIVGMLASFGFFVLPVLIAYRRIDRIPDPRDRMLVATLGLAVGLMTVDLIPNGLFNHMPLFLSGALLGVTQELTSPAALRAKRRAARTAPAVAAKARPTPPLREPDPRPASLAGARNSGRGR